MSNQQGSYNPNSHQSTDRPQSSHSRSTNQNNNMHQQPHPSNTPRNQQANLPQSNQQSRPPTSQNPNQSQSGPSHPNQNQHQNNQQQSQQPLDSPFDLSTFLSIPTANSMNASAGGNGNNGGGMHLPAGNDELYRAFAQGIQAGQNGMGMNDIRMQAGAPSLQGQSQGMPSNAGNGNGNGNNAQGRSQAGQQGQVPSNDLRRQSVSGSVNGNAAGSGNVGNHAGNGNGNGNGNNGSSNGNSNGTGSGSTSGLSPYGLDPSAFQSEVRFQMPSFLNPISSRPTHPNGAEAWSGYGMPQGMETGMFNQDFGPGSASHKPYNPMNGPGVPGNGSEKGMMDRGNGQQGIDGNGNGGMGMGSGHGDNGGMNQWENWNFSRQYVPPQYTPNPANLVAPTPYSNQNPKMNYGNGQGSSYEDSAPSGLPPQMGSGEEYDMSMPTSALLPNTAFPHSSSFASSSRMQLNTPQGANMDNNGSYDMPDMNAFASSSSAATGPAASLLASGGLGGLVNPETFSAQTPGGPNMPGLYSTSGFDMVSVLAKVAARKDPKTVLGPVDCSCSFVVADVRKFDAPIVYASPTFSQLTGYEPRELLGRNCRFLQSPDAEVAKGSRRKYTDNVAVAHMKRLLQAGKECQASLINYRKGGTPFINLVTVVPITWDNSEDIVYHVGFQVDLVEQPNAILRNMRDGSYQVNYMVQNNPQPPLKPAAKPVVEPPPPTSIGISKEMLDLLSQPAQQAVLAGGEEVGKHEWLKLVLSHTDDFVHVLSLKGQFQYVSPSVTRVLEYTPEELVNKHISDICHPSDIVPVMRELKDATHTPTDGRQAQLIHLLFRVRRKRSGYIWLESSGRLNIDTNKGRKAMILTGRERSVPAFCWKALDDHGGLGDVEIWAKISLEGLMLWLTGNIYEVFGAKANDLIGKSFYSVLPGAEGNAQHDGNTSSSAVEKAMQLSAEGLPKRGATSVRHAIIGKDGRSRDVQSTFFAAGPSAAGPITPPRESPGASDDEMRSNASSIIDAPPFQILLQIKILPSGMQKAKQVLMHPLLENVFEEMDTTRGTSWQYEVHQLKVANRKLKDEINAVRTGFRAARPDADDDNKKAKGKKRKMTESEPQPTPDHPTPLHQQTPGFGLAPGQLFKTWS